MPTWSQKNCWNVNQSPVIYLYRLFQKRNLRSLGPVPFENVECIVVVVVGRGGGGGRFGGLSSLPSGPVLASCVMYCCVLSTWVKNWGPPPGVYFWYWPIINDWIVSSMILIFQSWGCGMWAYACLRTPSKGQCSYYRASSLVLEEAVVPSMCWCLHAKIIAQWELCWFVLYFFWIQLCTA